MLEKIELTQRGQRFRIDENHVSLVHNFTKQSTSLTFSVQTSKDIIDNGVLRYDVWKDEDTKKVIIDFTRTGSLIARADKDRRISIRLKDLVVFLCKFFGIKGEGMTKLNCKKMQGASMSFVLSNEGEDFKTKYTPLNIF